MAKARWLLASLILAIASMTSVGLWGVKRVLASPPTGQPMVHGFFGARHSTEEKLIVFVEREHDVFADEWIIEAYKPVGGFWLPVSLEAVPSLSHRELFTNGRSADLVLAEGVSRMGFRSIALGWPVRWAWLLSTEESRRSRSEIVEEKSLGIDVWGTVEVQGRPYGMVFQPVGAIACMTSWGAGWLLVLLGVRGIVWVIRRRPAAPVARAESP